MARTTKNNIKKKDEPKPVHTCGECGWGKFYYEHSNLDMAGNPICLKSQYDTFGKSVRQMENETLNWSFFKISGF